MLAKRIVPCLDLHDGRVVKGVQFVDLVDAGDPVEQARFYDQSGADEVVFLDISATHEGRATLLDTIRRAADQVFIPLTVGGGVRAVEDVRALLEAGADKVAINSAALADPDLLTRAADAFGSQCVVLAIDAKRTGPAGGAPERGDGTTTDAAAATASAATATPPGAAPASGWEVFTHGGRRATGRDAVAWAVEGVRRGAGELLVTSMDRDGTRDGYDLDLLRALDDAVDVPVIASGGAGTLDHLAEGLTEGRADAVLAASMFHFREVTVAQAKAHLAAAGVTVRPAES